MEIRENESTELRPEGGRVLDAPLVSIDLAEYLKTIKNEKAWKEKDRNAITVYKSPGMRIVLVALHKGAEMPRHNADGIISVQVLDGEIKFGTDDTEVVLQSAQMIALHKGLYHNVKAIKESVFLLTLTTGV